MASTFTDIKGQLPILGIGLGLRKELADETFGNASTIDFLEVVPENYMELGGNARELLEKAKASFPLVTHGVNLSVGSTDELNEDYLRNLKLLLDSIDAPWWTDHLCFTSAQGIYMHDLLPLPFSREAVEHVAQRVKKVQQYMARPFLLENISFYMNLPGAELSEAQFLSEVLETADCGLLLDVNNVYVNSINHGFDARHYIDSIPLERTVQIHVAGHKLFSDVIIDTHGEPVIEPVYALLEYVLEQVSVKAVLLERDQNFPPFQELIDELGMLRKIAGKAQPELNSCRRDGQPKLQEASSVSALSA